MADPVVDGVAEDGGQHEQANQQPEVERAEGGKGACREEQRVARQEGGDNEARLHKDDEEQDGVRPYAVLADDVGQIGVEVQEEVNQEFEGVHWFLSGWDAGGHYNQFSVISVLATWQFQENGGRVAPSVHRGAYRDHIFEEFTCTLVSIRRKYTAYSTNGVLL